MHGKAPTCLEMKVGPYQSLSTRQRRAVALGALALIATAAASVAYLRPTLIFNAQVPASDVNAQPVSTHPMSFAFVTPSIGWASLVVDYGWDAGQFRLFRTTDGAQHWQQQLVLGGRTSYTRESPGMISIHDADTETVIPAIQATLNPISVQMFGEKRGIMTIRRQVEELYRTSDGGAHWNPVGLPPSLEIEDEVFSDPSHGWLVAASISTGGQSRSLYATRDGGNNWERLADLPGDAAGIHFKGPTEAWLGSDGPEPPHVYVSSDAGKSWQRHDLPAPAGTSWTSDRSSSFSTRIQLLQGVGAIASVQANPCFGPSTPCNNGNIAAQPETFLMMSGNAGLSWTEVPPPPGIVAYQDSSRWWATNTNALFKSTNAGQSWGQVATMPVDWQFTAPSVLDPMHAWAAVFGPAGYGLAVTNDGGVHWTLANVPNPQISP